MFINLHDLPSLVIKSKKGDTIDRQNIWARRPGNGEIPAFEFEKVLGKTLKRDIAKNTQIKWSDLE